MKRIRLTFTFRITDGFSLATIQTAIEGILGAFHALSVKTDVVEEEL